MNSESRLRERLEFLARLALSLNASLETRKVIETALNQLKSMLAAEAVTVFVLEPGAAELTFWAAEGGGEQALEGRKMPAGRGIVGWVIEQQQPVKVDDVQSDSRFFRDVDRESAFLTRNMLCVPLTTRGDHRIGAVQVLNSREPEGFSTADLEFLQHFASQLAIALENSRLYEALDERTRKLEILDRRKNEMISVIVHEFRTPLGIIQSAADMLSSGMLRNEDARGRMGQTMLRGVERLTRLVAGIKDLAVLSEGALGINRSCSELAEVFDQVVRYFAVPLKARGISLNVRLAPDAVSVYADPSLLLLVLKQLVSNAIRFTPDQGRVDLEAERFAGLITISVRDSGIGIAEHELSLIFDKFYEVGDAMQHSSGEYEFRSGGLGLGLATVRAVLEAHAASIEVESVLGQGSCFKFSLPAAA